jgi:hypothetical protein
VQDFGILLKSYGPDLPYAERFMASFERHATEPIPVFAVVPDEDVAAFTSMMAGRGTVLPESLWAHHLVETRIHGNSPGYINQEIIKLAFFEQGLLANYLCADSEAVFLRPFSSADFMADRTTPYTFVTEDSELAVDPVYEATYGARRREYLLALRGFLGLPEAPLLTCHNMAVFSASVLESLSAFLASRGLSYGDAMEISPYEFSWYNFWLERDRTIPRIVREPIFLMVHMEHQHLEFSLKDITEADLARGYVGVVVNSGFSRQFGVIDFDQPVSKTLASYVTLPDLVKALTERALRRMPRVRGALRI